MAEHLKKKCEFTSIIAKVLAITMKGENFRPDNNENTKYITINERHNWI